MSTTTTTKTNNANNTIITVYPRLKLVPITHNLSTTLLTTNTLLPQECLNIELPAMHDVLGPHIERCDSRENLYRKYGEFFEEAEEIGHEAAEIMPVLMIFRGYLVIEKGDGVTVPYIYGARLPIEAEPTVPHISVGARKFSSNGIRTESWHVLSYRAAECHKWLSNAMTKHLVLTQKKFLMPDKNFEFYYPVGAMQQFAKLYHQLFMVPQSLIREFHSKFPTVQRASLKAAADRLHCNNLYYLFEKCSDEELAEFSAALR